MMADGCPSCAVPLMYDKKHSKKIICVSCKGHFSLSEDGEVIAPTSETVLASTSESDATQEPPMKPEDQITEQVQKEKQSNQNKKISNTAAHKALMQSVQSLSLNISEASTFLQTNSIMTHSPGSNTGVNFGKVEENMKIAALLETYSKALFSCTNALHGIDQ